MDPNPTTSCRRTTLVIGVASILAATSGAQVSFRVLAPLPGDNLSNALAVSVNGSFVVGVSRSPSTGDLQAVRWSAAGEVEPLGFLADQTRSIPHDITADGSTVVGFSGNPSFIWTRSAGMQVIPVNGSVSAISSDGAYVVGTVSPTSLYRWSTADWQGENLNGDGYGWSIGVGDTSRDASSIAYELAGFGDQKVVFHHAFLWREGSGNKRLFGAGGSDNAEVYGVSDNGQWIVGSMMNRDGALRWDQNGNVLDLSAVGGWAEAVSDDGSVIIGGTPGGTPFVWIEGVGSFDLTAYLQANGVDVSGWTFTSYADMTPDGHTIAGIGRDPSGNVRGWIATIPSPASIAALCVPLAFAHHRRRS